MGFLAVLLEAGEGELVRVLGGGAGEVLEVGEDEGEVGLGVEVLEGYEVGTALDVVRMGGKEFLADSVLESCGGEDAALGAPAENPAFDFLEGTEMQGKLETPVGEVFERLAVVPLAFADEAGGKGSELKLDVNRIDVVLACKDPEGVGEFGGRIEVGRRGEGFTRLDGGLNPRQGETTSGFAHAVVGEEVGRMVCVDEGQRLDMASYGGVGFELVVSEVNRQPLGNGVIDCGVDGAVTRGDARLDKVGKGGLGRLRIEFGRQFAQRKREVIGVGGAGVELEKTLRDGEGAEFLFGEEVGGDFGDGGGVVEGVRGLVVDDGQAEAIAHEVEVSLDRAGIDGEVSR